MQCKKHAKEMKNAAAALGALKRKSIGLQEPSSKKDQEALESEKTLTQVIREPTTLVEGWDLILDYLKLLIIFILRFH